MAVAASSHVNHNMEKDANICKSLSELDAVEFKRMIDCGSESLKYIVTHFHPECKETEYYQHFAEQGENLLFLYSSALRIMQQCAALAALMDTNEDALNDQQEIGTTPLCEMYEEAFTNLHSMLSRWSLELSNVHVETPSLIASSATVSSSPCTTFETTSTSTSMAATSTADKDTTQMYVSAHGATRNAHCPTSTTWFVRHWFPDLEHFTRDSVFAAASRKDQADRLEANNLYEKGLLSTFAAADDWDQVINVAVGEWISTSNLSDRKTIIEDCLSLIQMYVSKIHVAYCRETGNVNHVMWVLFLTHVVFMITQYGVQWKVDMDQFDVCDETFGTSTISPCQGNDNANVDAEREKEGTSSNGVLYVLRTYLFTECFCHIVNHVEAHPQNETVNIKDLCNEIALSLLLLLTLEDQHENDVDETSNSLHRCIESQITKYITKHVVQESSDVVTLLNPRKKRRHGSISTTSNAVESNIRPSLLDQNVTSTMHAVHASSGTMLQKGDDIFTKCHEHYSQAALLFGFLRHRLLEKYHSRSTIPRRHDKRAMVSSLIPVLDKHTFQDLRDFERRVQFFLRYHGCVHIRHAFVPNEREQTWGREIPRLLALTDDVMLRLKTTVLKSEAISGGSIAVCPVEMGNNSFTSTHASATLTELGIVGSVQENADQPVTEHGVRLHFASILRTCGVVSTTQPGSALRIVSDEVYLRCKKNGFSIAHADYFAYKENGKLFGPHLNKIRVSTTDASAVNHASNYSKDSYDSRGVLNSISGQTTTELHAHGDAGDTCRVCQKTDGQENMVICDICEGSFHMNCVVLPICDITAATEWHCTTCVQSDLPVYTAWIPLQELHAENDSILAIVPRSHVCAGFDDPISAQLSLPSGFLPHAQIRNKLRRSDNTLTSNAAASAVSERTQNKLAWWMPDKVEFGDIIIFNTKTVHGATHNTSNRIRCSLDIRFVLDV
jgi:hypothetical protein